MHRDGQGVVELFCLDEHMQNATCAYSPTPQSVRHAVGSTVGLMSSNVNLSGQPHLR